MKNLMRNLFVHLVIFITIGANTVFGQEAGYHYEPQHTSGAHEGGFYYFFGDNLPDTTVTGAVKVESGLFMPHYYLDTNADSVSDFILAFGPWWYKPNSLSRPDSGEIITVSGKMHSPFNGNTVIVIEYLNGSMWRDLSQGLHWSGGWVNRNATDTTTIYCPVDSASFMSFPPGHMGMGGMWGSTFFFDMNQMPLSLMPDSANQDMIMGFHFEFINETGQDMMHGDWGGMGGMGNGGMGTMEFQNNLLSRFHYPQHLLDSLGLSEERLTLCYWDKSLSRWIQYVNGITKNFEGNYLELSSREVHDYVALFKTDITGIDKVFVADRFDLLEAYPNPFNPAVTIRFYLSRIDNVRLAVYSISGQLVKLLADGIFPQGVSTVKWDGKDFDGASAATGIYVISLRHGNRSLTRKVTLIK